MADLIGGFTPGFPGKNNLITGTTGADNIFGDPYTTGYPAASVAHLSSAALKGMIREALRLHAHEIDTFMPRSGAWKSPKTFTIRGSDWP